MMSGWGFSESPLVDGDKVICTPGGDDAAVVALNKETGKEIWRCTVPKIGDGKNHHDKDLKHGAAYSSVVKTNGAGVEQYIQLLGQGVVGIRAEDGKYLWGYEDVGNDVANIPTPIVRDDFVFVSTGYGTGSALLKLQKNGDGVSAEEVYFIEPKELQNHHGGLLLIGNHIFGGHKHGQGFPICVEMESGATQWGGDIRGEGKGSAAVTYADGHLIFRYEDGTLALIEANTEDYKLKGSFKPEFQEGTSWAHPVVVDGRLYLREQDKLMCYDLRANQ
jgi:outer membrane protein assembly factor BamB